MFSKYLNSLDAINDFDGGVRQVVGENATAGIFATYPQDFMHIMSAIGDQVQVSDIL